MINRSHNRIRKLKLDEYHRVEMTFDEKLRRSMRDLWHRMRHLSSRHGQLYEYYKEAFKEYLDRNRIPKQMELIKRTTGKLKVDAEMVEYYKGIQAIAYKREQPCAVVIEEALKEYLTKPENDMGMDRKGKSKIIRIL